MLKNTGSLISLRKEESLLGDRLMKTKNCPKNINKKALITDDYVKNITPLSRKQIDKLLMKLSSPKVEAEDSVDSDNDIEDIS